MNEQTQQAKTMQRVGAFLKTWLPIVVMVGGLITGYFLFKEETKHQFDLQRVEMKSLENEVKSLKKDINENRREWQRDTENELRELRENNIRLEMRIDALERSSRTPGSSLSGGPSE